jgi:erythromycin esterase-like protein
MANLDPVSAIRAAAIPLDGGERDYDELLELVGDARFVLLGEATHGTHEFYQERARITRRLIEEKGFHAVAVEADWPDAYRVNRYVRGQQDAQNPDRDANAALSGFQRFPNWMWRNTDVSSFVDWLREHNQKQAAGRQVGFYGLDLYSLFTSLREVLAYLDQVDPEAARVARARYACFDHYYEDSQHYGYSANLDLSASCEEGVIEQLNQMQRRAVEYAQQDGSADALFHAQQNARLVKNAEEYYRTMFRGRISSWNLRDSHMAETLDALAGHLSKDGEPARIVVWEHNSHIGDARATEVGQLGEWNVGELARKAYDGQTRLIGFSTYEGYVTAASEWDGPAEHKRVRPGMPGSYEALLHDTGIERFMLPLSGKDADDSPAREALMQRRLERAIGVIYLPRTERQSHYFSAQMAVQFDAVIHIDRTTAVTPLDAGGGWHSEEPPETYPEGF